MSLFSKIKELYLRMEDNYYDFIDYLASKGINLIPIVDTIDKYFPSFLLVIALFLSVLAFSGYWLYGLYKESQYANLTIMIKDKNTKQPIEATIYVDGTEYEGKSLILKLKKGTHTIKVEREDYNAKEMEINLSGNIVKRIYLEPTIKEQKTEEAILFASKETTIQIMDDQGLIEEAKLIVNCNRK